MSDIFNEVDDDLRHERYKKLWDKWGPYVIGFAVAIVVITAGNEGWRSYSTTRTEAESDRYMAAIQLLESGEKEKAATELTALANEASDGYHALALFHRAALLMDKGDMQAALDAFDELSRDPAVDKHMRELAAVKAVSLALDIETYDQVGLRVAPLLQEGSAYRLSVHELAGLNAQREGKFDEAKTHYSAVLGDPAAPPSLVQRVQELKGLIDAVTDGAKN